MCHSDLCSARRKSCVTTYSTGERRGNLAVCYDRTTGCFQSHLMERGQMIEQTGTPSFQGTTLSCGSHTKMEVVANCQNIYGPHNHGLTFMPQLFHRAGCQQLPTARCATVSCLVLRTERNLGSLCCELRGSKDRINRATMFC